MHNQIIRSHQLLNKPNRSNSSDSQLSLASSTSSSSYQSSASSDAPLSPPVSSLTSSITNQGLFDEIEESDSFIGSVPLTPMGSWMGTQAFPESPGRARMSSHQRSMSSSDSFTTQAPGGRRSRSGSFSSFLSALGTAGNLIGTTNTASIPVDELVLSQQQREERMLEEQFSAAQCSEVPYDASTSATPQKTSLHSHITLNSNYRQSISFVKQQYHLYKIFLIGHVQSTDLSPHSTMTEPPLSSTTRLSKDHSASTSSLLDTPTKKNPASLVNRKNFTVYLIEVHHQDRSILVSRRYSDFHQLYRYLKVTYPSHHFTIPPKKLVGNLSQQTIEKRKQGLKRLLWEVKQICGFTEHMHPQPNRRSANQQPTPPTSPSQNRNRGVSNNALPHQPFMWYQDPVIKEFFELNRFDENLIYRLPNSIWKSIFEFLGFNDLYRSIALTSKWLTRILYNQLRSASFSYLSHEVYFQNVPVAIDTNEELFDLIIRFAGLQQVTLERFHTIDNTFVERLVRQKGGKLQELNIRNCSLKGPLDLSGAGSNLQHLSLAYCTLIENVTLIPISGASFISPSNTHSKCHSLNLTGTNISDECLKQIIQHLPQLETLVLRSCNALIAPAIGGSLESSCSKRLRHVDLSHSHGLRALTVQNCDKLETLNLDYTAVSNHSLQDVLRECASHLVQLTANGCSTITSLTISSSTLSQLEFAGCKHLDIDSWRISCPQLKVLDFRLTNVRDESELRRIIDFEQSEWLEKAYFGDVDQCISSAEGSAPNTQQNTA